MSPARDNVSRPFEGYPAYGAVHDVIPNQQVRSFLLDFSRIADGVFSKAFETDEVDPTQGYIPDSEYQGQAIQIIEPGSNLPKVVATDYDPRNFYRVFDAENLGISVVEMDPSRRQAQAVRNLWQKNDFGAVENDAKNEIGRRLPNMVPRLLFNRVEGVGRRLPNTTKADVRQKLALFPDTTKFPETIDLIDHEAGIIIEAIRKRLKQFLYPWDTTAHLTFAVFRKAATEDQIAEIHAGINEHIARTKTPIGLQLGKLSFRSKLVRSRPQ